MADNILFLFGWLGELVFASWLLSSGAEHLAERWGGRFVGRTLLSIATTLPEIGIVVAAAKGGSYGTAIGSALGSNLFMMTLGLAIMLIIATTRLSKAPQKFIDVKEFKLDKIFLVITAVVGALLFIDGYTVLDGIVFTVLFSVYLLIAFSEMKKERQAPLEKDLHDTQVKSKKHFTRAMVLFVAGTVGIFVGAEPFVHALEGVSIDLGVSVVILAVIISPIAGEMPEKISMILLARKGANGASIAVANVLGSKILNNTLLLSVAIFAAMSYQGFTAKISNTPLLENQMILVTAITIVALIPMFKNKIGLKSGIMLLVLYAVGIVMQFILPGL
ncbi:MAG: sodium:calcium antiporter [Thaumarchaeota archaeon]|nr:sodium:calcium antiporter [Nitrososphaerota archaeon]MDE1832071.1 sodium:calcium antiporter [Nitrososphaerota archaeon]MDE1840356.1 sodium:calcium antiporter [Nitrososphaerota archaeon]MDE1878275.1 sodium:calcium antiporter [Nitrososphaerota archaeon]